MDTPDLNDELKKISVDGLKQLGDWIHQAKDFAVEQAPLFAQEYAKWWTVNHLIGALTCFALTIPFLWLATKGAKVVFEREGPGNNNDGMYTTFGFLLRAAFSIACFWAFIDGADHLKDAAKGYYAPRVVLVEGIGKIVKNSQVCKGTP